MKKSLLFFVFIISFSGYSQEDAWVYFKDKPNSQFYFDNPLEMLSQRSLDRRIAFSIPLDSKDVPIHAPYVNQLIAFPGIDVKAKSKWFNAVHVRGAISDIDALTNLSFVDHIQFANAALNQANRVSKIVQNQAVNKILDTNVVFAYGNSGNQIQMLNGQVLHEQEITGTGKIIAVMDAGFPGVTTAAPFQRLLDNNQILGGYNFVDRNDNFYTGNSHGTLVLSTMGGYVENELVGTAPDSGYYLFITEDAGSETPLEESNWVEAAEVADSLGVDIISTSLGYFEYDNPSYSYTYADMNGTTSFISKGADIAFSRGMICVASAGNSGNSANPHIAVPSDAINTLAIGAVKFDETYATFSSIGPSFDGRVKPDVMAQGQSSVLSTPTGDITTGSGTSFSGPIMAGMIASFWQAIPWANNAAVIQFVKQSADRFSNPNEEFGYGIPDFQIALNMALLSVNEVRKQDFTLFPNPVNTTLTINSKEPYLGSKIFLYNNLGQIVFQQDINAISQNISLEHLNSGIYFYTIQSENKTQKGKIIKR